MEHLDYCPFCPGEAEVKKFKYGFLKLSAVFYVRCTICGAQTAVKETEEDAVRAWNRATPPPLEQEDI